MSGSPTVDALLQLITQSATAAVFEYKKYGALPNLEERHPLDDSVVGAEFELRKIIRVLEASCEQLKSTLAPPNLTVTNRAITVQETACMRVVVEGRVADILESYPKGLPVDDIAEKTSLNGAKLGHVLRMLATRHCFTEVSSNVFANNRVSLSLLSSNPISSLVGHWSDEHMKYSCGYFYEGLSEPGYKDSFDPKQSPLMCGLRNASKETGDWEDKTVFAVMQTMPKRRERFGRAMKGAGLMSGARSVVNVYPFRDLPQGTKVADIGGGVGNVSVELAKAYPQLKLTLQDLSETIEDAKKLWNTECPSAVSEKRIDFIGKSFFDGIIQGQDIYYLSQVIHDWADAESIAILSNIRSSMAPNGKVLIHDYVLQSLTRQPDSKEHSDVAPEPLLPNYGSGSARKYMIDTLMLASLNGKERSLEEFVALGSQAGLTLKKVWDTMDTSVLEFQAT